MNIVYFQYPWRFWRTRLAGIYRYAASAGWRVQVIEHGLTALPVAKAIAFWRPDGCIVERSVMDTPGFRVSDFRDTPVVYCDANPKRFRRPSMAVVHDSSGTAALAARELISLGFRNFAFVGNIIPRDWSDRRRKVMAAEAAKAGGTFASFEPGGPDSIAAFFASIRPWLRALPTPCGLLAANDISADLVLQACAMEQIEVPDEIAVIGIDNDTLICRHATPTLTSVMPDFEQSGYLAAQLLDEAMSGNCAPRIVKFGAAHIVRRNSTIKFKRRDSAVRRAVARIRETSGVGLTPAEICREIGGSRRGAEYRFREATGRSIGEEIAAARVEHAKTLLLLREQPIESIAAECGYEDASSLRRAFKKATGLSLRDWRNAAESADR